MLEILASCSSVRFRSWNLSTTIARNSWAASWLHANTTVKNANIRYTILMVSLLLIPGTDAPAAAWPFWSRDDNGRRRPTHSTALQCCTSFPMRESDYGRPSLFALSIATRERILCGAQYPPSPCALQRGRSSVSPRTICCEPLPIEEALDTRQGPTQTRSQRAKLAAKEPSF